MQPKLWPYIGGIARSNGFTALTVGGTEDHVHVLLSLPPTMPVAKAIQLIKGGSSKWMNAHTQDRRFAWQDGYGAFSIGTSQLEPTIHYIQHQEQHHVKMEFDEELRLILKRHGIIEYQEENHQAQSSR